MRQQLALENEMNRPKVVYFDNLASRNLLTNLRDTAKQIHIPQNKFISLLIDNKYLYRDAKEKLKPYSQYVPMYFELKDFEKNGHAGTQLLVTPKGKERFVLCGEELDMRTEKQYDLSGFNQLFNESLSPRELADELVQLLFNYASCVDEGNAELFRNDASTIYLIHQELINIKE